MSQPRKKSLRAALLPRLVQLTRRMPPSLALQVRPLLAAGLAAVPGWKKRVRHSMEAALGPGGYRAGHVDAYFRHLADLFAYSAIVYRSGVGASELAGQWELDPEAVSRYQEALAAGKGALMVCPHLIGHEIMAGSVTAQVPITVLVRQSPEPEYEALKQEWYRAIGVEVAYRPRKGGDLQGLGEMTAALRALRKNRVLAITPDLIRKPGTGVPVRLFGRQVELPAGAFFLAVRTGAPLLPSFFHYEKREGRTGSRYRLWTFPALEVPATGDRDAAVADLAQRWATLFEAFIREHPDMWQFWLDKRWIRWLEQNPRGEE